MKTNVTTVISALIIGACMMFALNGCEDKNALPREQVAVLKLKKPEYKNNILAFYYNGDDSIVATRFNHCEAPVGRAGYSPYWELPDDWLLVDWKWQGFPYPDKGRNVLLVNQTWEKYPSEAFPLPKWPVLEPYISNPIDELVWVQIPALEEYSKTQYSYELKALVLGKLHVSDTICLCEYSDRADSSWAVLQKSISDVIQNGDLMKLSRKRPF